MVLRLLVIEIQKKKKFTIENRLHQLTKRSTLFDKVLVTHQLRVNKLQMRHEI